MDSSYRLIAIGLLVVLYFMFGCAPVPVKPEDSRAPSAESKLSEESKKAIKALEAAGFQCSNRGNATQCGTPEGQKSIANYPQAVTVIVPHFLQTKDKFSAIKRFQYFFHGHMLDRRGYEWYLDYFRLADQFASLGWSHGILIVPESLGNCVDFETYFNTPGNFDRFNFALMDALKMSRQNPVTVGLSGHSGSYRAIANIVSNETRDRLQLKNQFAKNIRHIGLVDATYGDIPRFQDWALFDASHKLTIVCATPEPCAASKDIENARGQFLPNVVRTVKSPAPSGLGIHYDAGIQCLQQTWRDIGC